MTADGGEIESEVWLYVANTQDDFKNKSRKPNAAYRKHFVDGAKHHRLPQHYVDKLMEIKTLG